MFAIPSRYRAGAPSICRVVVRAGLAARFPQYREDVDDWTSYMILLPPGDDARKLEEFLRTLGFAEDDWCAMNRADRAHVSWGPMETPSEPPPWALA